MHEHNECITIEREGGEGVKRGNKSSNVSGKKARKCEIVLKLGIISDITPPTTTIEEGGDISKKKILSTFPLTSSKALKK